MGVNVVVEVDGGMAAAVCADAASAVCAINMLMAFESSGGMGVGVANVGIHPTISVRMMNSIHNLIFGATMFPLRHPNGTPMDALYD